MRINFFFRHPSVGVSIQRVFGTLIEELRGNHDIVITEMPNRGSMPRDVIINGIYTRKNNCANDINHITGHIHDSIMFLKGSKKILTIHDLVFLDNVKNPFKRFYKWFFWLYIPIKVADRVTCISEQTKQNILKHVYTSKIQVIHNPVDPSFRFVDKEFDARRPRILHIGTGWNKNLNRVIESLAGLDCELRIIGKINQNVLELLEKYQINYTQAFGLSDGEILDEYKKCDIVSFPSQYEGFGMPIIEGQAIGRPVLTSHIEPLIEVSGDAVCYVNPLEVTSIRAGFVQIISDAAYREQLVNKGLQNADRFSVESIANQYLSLYKTLL